MNGLIKYRFYATALDSFQSWLSSSEIYQDYFGFSENPAKSEEEFEKEQFQSLIDSINRVPMKWEDSEKADRGTAFNEVIDCVLKGIKSEKMEIKSDKQTGLITVNYNKRIFVFSITLVMEFVRYYKGATSQVYTEGILPTRYGDVLLYGYIDELMPLCVHDIKTTTKYKVGKFRNNWQHVVYPFCLSQSGNKVTEFEYNVAVLGTGNYYSTFTELYSYDSGRDIARLIAHTERFIEFIEANKHLITDKKIINY